MQLKNSFVLYLIVFRCSFAANILFLSILPSPSHHIWNSALSYELAKHGHNMTIISPDSNKLPPNGIHYILIETLYGDYRTEYTKHFFHQHRTNSFKDYLGQFDAWNELCVDALKSNGFKTLLNYPDDFQFDLVLYDFTIGPCFLPFLHKFKYPPMIAVSAFNHPSYLNHLIGGHHYYAYVPHNAMETNDNMTFWERFLNLIVYLEEYVLHQYVSLPQMDKAIAKYFDANSPSVNELQQRAKLALINTNPSFDYLAPLPENVIPVAGLHIKEPKPLSKELEYFCNSSKKGVVLFALGTNLHSEYMPIEKQKLFIDVFAELSSYHFLWKFESNFTATELPKNVRISPWLPQSDILAHPKCKAFISHCGMLSTQEAIWRGVPVIGMPFGFDQHQNSVRLKRLGVAEGLDFRSLTKNELREKLLQVVEDPIYAKNAKRLSARFQDQKEPPLERAVFWIEWVLRNPDCDYLKSPVLRLGYIVSNSLDLVAFIAFAFIAFLFVCRKIFSYCFIRFRFYNYRMHHKLE